MPAFRPTRPTFIGHTTAGHSLASGFQPIPVDVVDQDDAGGWSGTQYTLDRDGLWLAFIFASRNSLATATKSQTRILQNGTVIAKGGSPQITQSVTMSLTALFHGALGDVLDLQVLVSPTITASINDDARVFVTRVGPKSWNF